MANCLLVGLGGCGDWRWRGNLDFLIRTSGCRPSRRPGIRWNGSLRWSISKCFAEIWSRRCRVRIGPKGDDRPMTGIDVQGAGFAALYTLSDDQTEYQLKDRLSFMRFVGLAMHDPVPDAKTIWLYREQLARAGAAEQCSRGLTRCCAQRLAGDGRPDRRCDGDRGAPAAADQVEKDTIKGGGVPSEWHRRGARRSTATGAGPSSAAKSATLPTAPVQTADRDRGAGVWLQEPHRH